MLPRVFSNILKAEIFIKILRAASCFMFITGILNSPGFSDLMPAVKLFMPGRSLEHGSSGEDMSLNSTRSLTGEVDEENREQCPISHRQKRSTGRGQRELPDREHTANFEFHINNNNNIF